MFSRCGWLVFKIVDGSMGKKPFDIAGCDALGFAAGIEVKVYRKKTPISSIPEDQFEVHQLYWLKKYAQKGASSLAIAYCEHEDKLMIWDFNDLDKHMILTREHKTKDFILPSIKSFSKCAIPKDHYTIIRID